jgi:HK97 family phage major capsid protein
LSINININASVSKKNALIKEAQSLVNEGKAHSAAYRSKVDEIDTLNTLIDLAQRAGLDKGEPIAAPVVAAPAVITQRDSAEHRAKVNDAARQFFRHGVSNMNAEQRALLTTSDAAGGAVVSQGFDDAFVEASKFYGPIFNLVHRKDTATGQPTKFVVSDGTNQTFSLLTEGSTSAASKAQQPTVFSDINNTDTLVSSVIYSVQEADDAFDLTSFLMRIAGLAVSRARETAITVGTTNDGTNTALPSTPTGGFLASVSAGVTQTAGQLAAGPTYAQLSALAGSVDRSYYQTGSFMASPSVETFLRSQVDSTGRPLYPIDANTGYLQIAGRLLYPNAAMPAAGTASSPLVLFGDYSKAWNVQNAGVGLKVVTSDGNPNLIFLTRELIVWTRLGQSAGLNTAVKALVSAAS